MWLNIFGAAQQNIFGFLPKLEEIWKLSAPTNLKQRTVRTFGGQKKMGRTKTAPNLKYTAWKLKQVQRHKFGKILK